MKIQIVREIKEVVEIEVDLPYYYKHDLGSDNGDVVIYGRIDEKRHSVINESIFWDDSVSYELESSAHSSIKRSGLSSYFAEKFNSTEDEYNAAKSRCITFLNSKI